MKTAKKVLVTALTALLGSSALSAVYAQDISFIVCGDTVDPLYVQYIEEWQAANAGWTITPEVVGWGQCQDKVTTLAAAGTPVGLAYVGSRTQRHLP